MLNWIKNHSAIIIASLVSIGLILFMYGCEPEVNSLIYNGKRVNRSELQYELSSLVALAEVRMLDLDKQDQLRAIILQNALIIVSGQPYNPVGIITAFAAVYGLTQGGTNITKVVKNTINKRKGNNV